MVHISVIIVTYHPNKSVLIKQHSALKNQVDSIIYVDNGSGLSLDFLSSEKKITIYNETNLGIAKAQNQGIAKARQLGATHVLLLDQDSIVGPNMVNELMLPFLKNNDIGAVGPCIINAYNGQSQKYGHSISGFKLKKIPLNKEFNEVSYVIASGCLIPISVLDDVGDMNESMFIDGVDFEWCLRAKSKGFKVLQSSSAKLWHELGNGEKDRILSHSSNREYYIVRNSILMSRMSHLPFLYRMRRFAMGFFRVISCLSIKKIEYFRQGIKGFKEGLLLKTTYETVLLPKNKTVPHQQIQVEETKEVL